MGSWAVEGSLGVAVRFRYTHSEPTALQCAAV